MLKTVLDQEDNKAVEWYLLTRAFMPSKCLLIVVEVTKILDKL